MPIPHPVRVLAGASPALLVLLGPASALAGDPAAAQALYDEAKELASQGRHAEACRKLEESERLDPGLGTEFHLADCWQRVGRTAKAWAMFRQVESEARATGQSGRERVARDRAEALGAFLSKIAIDPAAIASTTGAVVSRDGVEIAREQWGEPVPVDPGPHVVSVRAPGKQPWETTVQVLPDGKVVHVEVPALADSAPAAAPASPATPAAAPPPATTTPAPRAERKGATAPMPPSYEMPMLDDRGGGQRALGWFFIGAGVAAVGASSYFWLKWVDDRNAPISSTDHADAPNQSRLGEAVAGGGAFAIVLGAIVAATAPSPRLVLRSESRVQVSPWVGAGRGGFIVGGTF